jgi:hypothetical protein
LGVFFLSYGSAACVINMILQMYKIEILDLKPSYFNRLQEF